MSSKASKLAPIDPLASGFVGVFDSGIGGLSVLQALRVEMPHERFIYWSDSAYAPYGERSDAFVIDRCNFITKQFFARGNVKSVVIACNTATAVGIESLRLQFPQLKFVGVEPALKPASGVSNTGRIGVIGTHATLQSARFAKLLDKVLADAAPDACEFIIQPCQGLALAIERLTANVHSGSQEVEELCALYLKKMGSFGHAPGQMDTLVLGCTHYVFAQDIFRQLLGPTVNIISTGSAVAKQTQRLSMDSRLEKTSKAVWGSDFLNEDQPQKSIELWTTGPLSALEKAAKRWLTLPPDCCHRWAPSSI